jgi:hypothetical protein
MDDQREENKHHQIEEFSFVYHNRLPGIPLVTAKRVPGAMGSGAITLVRFLKESLLVNLRLQPSAEKKTGVFLRLGKIDCQI